MEYEYAFGRVESIGSYGGNSAIATIQVIGLFDSKTKTVKRYKGRINNLFRNRGKVFAPNFANDFPNIHALNYIVFNYCENKKLTADDWNNPSKDLYMLPAKHDGGSASLFPCFPVAGNIPDEDLWNPQGCSDEDGYSKLTIHQGHLRKQLLKLGIDKSVGEQSPLQPGKSANGFFFIRKRDDVDYICGRMNSDLTPKTGKEIRAWKVEDGDIFTTEDGEKLLVVNIEKRQPDFWIDCMTDKQLSEWFKKITLQKGCLSPDLQETVKNTILNDNGDRSLNEKRWERIQRHLNKVLYDFDELQKLKDNPVFHDIISASIDKNINAILEENKAVIERRKNSLEQEYIQKEKELYRDLLQKKESLEKDIEKLGKDQSEKEKTIAELSKEKEKIEEETDTAKRGLQNLFDKKEDLINDIRIQADLGLFSIGKTLSESSWCYPLEHINQDQPSIKQYSDTNTESPLAHLFRDKILIVDDIFQGLGLSYQLGNVIYQLCQPSPKWISFHEFWIESLCPIWESAHQKPDIWHVLLIENYNIALPECWGKPLWNILSGKTTLLPCAKNPNIPDNLRIIVSEAATDSEDDSHLGLPTKVGEKWTRIRNGHVE